MSITIDTSAASGGVEDGQTVRKGIPGLRGTEHIGFNVPNMAQAHEFLVNVLGCEHVYTLGAKEADDDWMREHLGVHPRTVLREIRYYRLGFGTNLEAVIYEAADEQAPQPRNSDLGSFHIALYVDDMDAAVDYLASCGINTMGSPTPSKQAAAGQHWVYFTSPWGMQFELVSYPDGKGYEEKADRLLWHPAHPAE